MLQRYKIKAILHFSFIICLKPCPIFPDYVILLTRKSH